MPELAEVDFNRRQWNSGLGAKIRAVRMHSSTRVFRSVPVGALAHELVGTALLDSEAKGKQILFRFSKGIWLGVHLGMTGKLHIQKPGYQPGKHDHLVLEQDNSALVFTDMRQFGRIRFHRGPTAPEWWQQMPPALISKQFTVPMLEQFLQRHRRLAIKPALLLQKGFPGIGNWMADEILWRARLHPRLRAGSIRQARAKTLWRQIRFVCRQALEHVGPTYWELPPGWLFQERWEPGGKCPRDGSLLRRARIGGRTTAWCPKCQPGR